MSAILLAPLNELQALSHTLFLSLSPIQTKPPPAPPLSAFLACDNALSSAINLAHKHQIKQRRIDALELEILELEARWREIASELESGERELEEMIEEGEVRIKAIEAAKKGKHHFHLPGFNTSQFYQRLYLTPNFWPTLKVLARSLPLRQICQI